MPVDESAAQVVRRARQLGDLVNGHPDHVEEVLPELVHLLTGTDDPEALQATVTALGDAWHPAAAAALLDHVDHDHPDARVRLACAQALPGGVDAEDGLRDRVIDVLVHLTGDAEASVRDWAAFGLGQLRARSAPARDALAVLLRDPDHDTSSEALVALAGAGDPRARPVLLQRLESGGGLSSLDLQAAAALASSDLHPALLRLTREWGEDEDEFTDVLATALARCDPRAAQTARQVEQDVLAEVRRVLGQAGLPGLVGDYPGTALTVPGSDGGDDLHLPLWDEDQRPDRYPTAAVVDVVRAPVASAGGRAPHGSTSRRAVPT